MAVPATASALFAGRMLALAGLRGADVPAMAEAVGLDLAVLSDRDARIDHDQLLRLWDEITVRLGDEHFGLHLSEHARQLRDNVLVYAVQSCATLEAALRCVIRYMLLVTDAGRTELATDETDAILRFRARPGDRLHPQGAEFATASACWFVRQHVDASFSPTAVAFGHAAPRSIDEHRRVFGVEPRFGAEHTELRFARGLLSQPLRAADPALLAHLERYLTGMLESLPSGKHEVVDQVRTTLSRALRGGPSDVSFVATRLRMSPRHLQRRLREAGTSFQELLDETRHDIALRYLDEPNMTLAEVGFLLGFAEPSNFHRAFKRWTGLTPAEARRRRRAERA